MSGQSGVPEERTVQMSVWGDGWIDKRSCAPCAEDASEKGEVLVWHRRFGWMLAWWGIVACSQNFTHWMRLPARPEGMKCPKWGRIRKRDGGGRDET